MTDGPAKKTPSQVTRPPIGKGKVSSRDVQQDAGSPDRRDVVEVARPVEELSPAGGEESAVIPNPPPMAISSPPVPAMTKAERPLTGRGEVASGYDLSGLDGSEYSGRYGNILKLLHGYVS